MDDYLLHNKRIRKDDLVMTTLDDVYEKMTKDELVAFAKVSEEEICLQDNLLDIMDSMITEMETLNNLRQSAVSVSVKLERAQQRSSCMIKLARRRCSEVKVMDLNETEE